MFPGPLRTAAEAVLNQLRLKGLHLVTAESCTGGLISGVLTEIAGASDVIDCGFVTYSNAAKTALLDVPSALIEKHGAVSQPVALAMAHGALKNAHADIAVAVTGLAGPGGGSAEKPVGLVYIAAVLHGRPATVQRFEFGDIGRSEIRLATVREALKLIEQVQA